jgi:hypothetical protein
VYGNSPIVIDIAGNGFALTNANDGVSFDIDGDQIPEAISWIATGSDDAWLALDRNGNGAVDNGGELFGNFTAQTEPPSHTDKNGFRALAEFDKAENGGNADGFITDSDSVFNSLRLWQDVNHNGISEAGELFSLPSKGMVKFELDYRSSKRTDEFGNRFRYRAKVRGVNGSQISRWAWDVFLTHQTETSTSARSIWSEIFASSVPFVSSKSACKAKLPV